MRGQRLLYVTYRGQAHNVRNYNPYAPQFYGFQSRDHCRQGVPGSRPPNGGWSHGAQVGPADAVLSWCACAADWGTQNQSTLRRSSIESTDALEAESLKIPPPSAFSPPSPNRPAGLRAQQAAASTGQTPSGNLDRGGSPQRTTSDNPSDNPPDQIELQPYPTAAEKYRDFANERQRQYDVKRAEKRRWLEQQDEMKFSHSIQFNAVPDWSNHYIAYSNLKKL